MNTYCCSDFHGQYALYEQIKSFIQPEDKVYCLGDCADRGPEGWKTLRAVLEDPQFTLIKGNHEDMLVNAMKEYLEEEDFGEECMLLFSNGGQETLAQWIADGASIGWTFMLDNLMDKESFINSDGVKIFMSHSGAISSDSEELIWDRNHIIQKWKPNFYDVVVHGHTPIPALIKYFQKANKFYQKRIFPIKSWDKDGAYWYEDNHKVDIDCGSFVTNMIVLLDLNSFDEHIFTCGE
jgi:calcineurin-like phosphoesterase family protein